MAYSSSSSGSWDPCKVLEVNPWNPPNSTCRGEKRGGWRCGWRFNSEGITFAKTDNAKRSLKSMSERHPSSIDHSTLYFLAQNTLCYWHGDQAGRICADWKAAIEDYLPEHNQRLARVTPVKQEPYESRDTKQLQNGSAKEPDMSEQEIKPLRHALEEAKAELGKSEARCSALLAKNSNLDRQRQEEQASQSSLKQQLTDYLTRTNAREEQISKEIGQLRTRFEKEKNEEVERLRSQLAGRNVSFEKNVKASCIQIKGLEARIKELEALNLRLVDGREEDVARVKELEGLNRELVDGRDEKVARVKELEALNRKLMEGREEEVARMEGLREQVDRLRRELKGREEEAERVRKEREREVEGRQVGCFLYCFLCLCLKSEQSDLG